MSFLFGEKKSADIKYINDYLITNKYNFISVEAC